MELTSRRLHLPFAVQKAQSKNSSALEFRESTMGSRLPKRAWLGALAIVFFATAQLPAFAADDGCNYHLSTFERASIYEHLRSD